MEYVIFKFITGNENWQNTEYRCMRQQIIGKNVGGGMVCVACRCKCMWVGVIQ